MNRKMIKEKNIKTKLLELFQAKQNTDSADSISLYSKYTTLKMLWDKAECKGTQRKARRFKQKH